MTFKQALDKAYPEIVFRDKDGNVALTIGHLIWTQDGWYTYRITMGLNIAGAHVILKEKNRIDKAELTVRIEADDYAGSIREMLSSAMKIFQGIHAQAKSSYEIITSPGKLTEIAGTLVNGKAVVAVKRGCVSLADSMVTYTQAIPDGKDYTVNGNGILMAEGSLDEFELDEMLFELQTFLSETAMCGLPARLGELPQRMQH